MKKKIVMMMLALTVFASVTACGTQGENKQDQAVRVEKDSERVDEEKQEKGEEGKIQTKELSAEQQDENYLEEDSEEMEDVEDTEDTEDTENTEDAENTEDTEDTKIFTIRLDQVDVVSLQGKHILLNVPEGFTWDLASEENEGGCFFSREDDKETVYIGFWDRLLPVDEEYCDEDLEVPYYATGTESEVMTEEINGRTVYYKHISYEYESPYSGKMVYYETVKAMCEVGDDHMLVVETDGASGEEADFDEIRGFFEFEEL